MLALRRSGPTLSLLLRRAAVYQCRARSSGLLSAFRPRTNVVNRSLLPSVHPTVFHRSFADLPSHFVVKLPALSPTMETGTIISWEKAEGDEVEQGDSLAQVETDKATMDMESSRDGFLAKILVPEGTSDIPLGREVCIIVKNQEDVAAFENYVSEQPASPPQPAQQEQQAPPAAQQAPPPEMQAATPTPQEMIPQPLMVPTSSDRTFASPYARTQAKQMGVDLSSAGISGTGPYGSVVAGDLAGVVSQPAPVQAVTSEADYEDEPHSQTRKTIAQRLSASKSSIPHYYVTFDINMSAMLQLRKKLNEVEGVKVSVNDLLIKAVANTIRDNPSVNCEWMDHAIRRHKQVNISVAVDSPKGLITPVVARADTKGLGQISADMSTLRQKAVEGKLQPSEYQGGTFTISNMGMKGARQFTAIINPPQSCILAVGAVEKRPVYCEKSASGFKMADMMTVTMSSDHRTVDGAQAADWLQQLKRTLENPESLLL